MNTVAPASGFPLSSCATPAKAERSFGFVPGEARIAVGPDTLQHREVRALVVPEGEAEVVAIVWQLDLPKRDAVSFQDLRGLVAVREACSLLDLTGDVAEDLMHRVVAEAANQNLRMLPGAVEADGISERRTFLAF